MEKIKKNKSTSNKNLLSKKSIIDKKKNDLSISENLNEDNLSSINGQRLIKEKKHKIIKYAIIVFIVRLIIRQFWFFGNVCPPWMHITQDCGMVWWPNWIEESCGEEKCVWPNYDPPALKPVIYLYPTNTQDTKVQLNYKWTLIADYPVYNKIHKLMVCYCLSRW